MISDDLLRWEYDQTQAHTKAESGRLGGLARTRQKARAAKENGSLGGRTPAWLVQQRQWQEILRQRLRAQARKLRRAGKPAAWLGKLHDARELFR